MHLSPGVPIVRSHICCTGRLSIMSMTNWLTATNCPSGTARTLRAGVRANSLRYNNGLYYLVTFSYTTGKNPHFQDCQSGEGSLGGGDPGQSLS